MLKFNALAFESLELLPMKGIAVFIVLLEHTTHVTTDGFLYVMSLI